MAITTVPSALEGSNASTAGSSTSANSNAPSPSTSTSNAATGSDTNTGINKVKKAHPVPSDVYEESVYSLIPIEYTPPAKQGMYRSKYAGMARTEYKSGTKEAASMGPAKIAVRTTDGFLKKGDREKKSPHVEKHQPDRSIRKAPVPKAVGVAAHTSDKNFIKLNALENINSSAKKPINNTPCYKSKPDYGAVPSYLDKRKKELEQIKIMAAAAEEEEKSRNNKNGLVPLPEEERLKILDGLKANWEKLNSDYQKLSLTVDTVPKIARKVNMEQQLQQLEAHIAKFSHSNVLVDFNSL
ncbi:hypothetical protein HDV05_003350 [Chytridiales sp. JEL 0842]|nr:hypothetical protein HDV05_003350 [Chytridiales sp. JEL 0842]